MTLKKYKIHVRDNKKIQKNNFPVLQIFNL